jgi:hypothetical protein
MPEVASRQNGQHQPVPRKGLISQSHFHREISIMVVIEGKWCPEEARFALSNRRDSPENGLKFQVDSGLRVPRGEVVGVP